LDLTLCAQEQRERELRLVRFAEDGEEAALAWDAGDAGDAGDLPAATEVWRLQQDVERLASFHQAVLRSRAWRLVQWARRPFGRAW
jgi:hypothetical protein